MLFAYQKPILTLASRMMMTIWKFPVIIYLEQNIDLTLKDNVFGGKLYIFFSLYHSPNQSHKILNVHTKTNEQERAGTNWNELESPETSWNHLERAGITWTEMDSATN